VQGHFVGAGVGTGALVFKGEIAGNKVGSGQRCAQYERNKE